MTGKRIAPDSTGNRKSPGKAAEPSLALIRGSSRESTSDALFFVPGALRIPRATEYPPVFY